MDFCDDSRSFCNSLKSPLGIMRPKWHIVVDFVEIMYHPPSIPRPILMEDGTPIQHTQLIKKWHQALQSKQLAQPTQLPNLNSIENLWLKMKLEVQRHPTMPNNVKEMKVTLQEIQVAIKHATFVPLIKSILKCMANMIKAKRRINQMVKVHLNN